jgi:hypothetical protein
MVFPRVISGMILFQLTMVGLFFLKDSYVLGALCIPLIVLTLIFKFTIDAAYTRNSLHLPMELLRDQETKIQALSAPVEERDDNAVTTSSSSAPAAAEKTNAARKRWTTALKSIQNTTRNRFDRPAKHHHQHVPLPLRSERRKRHMILDEDNYKGTPDNKTDYRQPPMLLNPGVLDTGLKWYGNPYLVGELPQLWLPVQRAGDTTKRPQQETPTRPSIAPITFGTPKHASSGSQEQEGDDYRPPSSTTALDIAHVVRLLEESQQTGKDLDQVCVHEGGPQQSSPASAPSFFGRLLGTHSGSHHGDGSQQQQQQHDSSDDSSDDSSGDDSSDSDDDDNNLTSVFHRIYYHHPERRHSTHRLHPSFMNRLHSSPSTIPLLHLNNRPSASPSPTG